MFQLIKMTAEMHDEVLAMVHDFYHSDAVSHPVPVEPMERSFADAVSDDPVLEGLLLKENDETVGFAYVTEYYACEVGGRCLMIEELFVKEAYRGKGYGTRFFEKLKEDKPRVRRFRLEVSADNEAAVRLYKRLGFTFLTYDQMVCDR